ncbi:MFS transporter [Alteromonas sp. a30]|uniref:MFS transporter n=1 Tax=Alteromonas sp. a30 TaxID=2730917 RepID=UPI002280699B|nr:MFS transporter [Alteromonas sp. a30]MCY7295177.1 hypothetical protein [Alteromonas sp. a30]
MTTKLPLIVMGVNQTLVIALLPQLGSHFSLSQDVQDWGWLIGLLNVNLVAYWIASGWWGNKINEIGVSRAKFIATFGLTLSTLCFALAFYLPTLASIIVIGLSRLVTGCFTAAFIPIAQSEIASKGEYRIGLLSRQSSYITLGRFASPLLIFLPIPFHFILLIPSAISLVSLLFLVRETQPFSFLPPLAAKVNLFHGLSNLPPCGLLLALSTTALVTCTQLIILPFIIKMGYSPEHSSQIYAQLMLFISVIIIISQRWILPYASSVAALRKAYLYILLLLLHLGAGLLSLHFNHWVAFAPALACIAIGITGIPAWYTHQLFDKRSPKLSQSQVSGGVAQAHSLGHILGTMLSAGILLVTIEPQLLLWPITVLITFCAYLLSQLPDLSANKNTPTPRTEV